MSFIQDRINDVYQLTTDFENASPVMKVAAGVAALVTTFGVAKGIITADQTALYGSLAAGVLGTGMIGFLNGEEQRHNAAVAMPTRDGP